MKLGEFYNALRKAVDDKKLAVEILGYTGHKKNYPIFSIMNKLNKKRKTVCFLSGIHGDEIAPPIAILNFIKNFNFDKLNNINLIFIPVANQQDLNLKRERIIKI